MGKLNDKITVVTGSGSGIGEATAKLFSEEGATVVLADINEEAVKRVKGDIETEGGKAIYFTGDISKVKDCDRMVENTIKELGNIDILINNAGIADGFKGVVTATDEIWNDVIDINLTGLFYMCRAVMRHMVKEGKGVIVNISSVGGVYGSAGVSYSASKAGVLGLTKNIAMQYADKGIRCNAVCPGTTLTPMILNPEFFANADEDMRDTAGKHCDLSLPPVKSTEQAKAILFFASDDSSAVNGQYLVVDRGAFL